ncbi:hypothetical protein HN832_04205 [archaeon]|jgi:hypothetical protein|nr:hypothetical protein [archaeon]MBT4373403.1 hypothetical protein [archaeon]MBT4531851.1 hypothetical protein [archaeon]MBT7001518.1 hypothetical protein [archaeon]MBT7282590.1 hypothetical protein [archaeon]
MGLDSNENDYRKKWLDEEDEICLDRESFLEYIYEMGEPNQTIGWEATICPWAYQCESAKDEATFNGKCSRDYLDCRIKIKNSI